MLSGFDDGPRCHTPADQSRDKRDVRQRDQDDVSPKTPARRTVPLRRRPFRHLIRFCFGGDTDLGDSRALQCVHHSDQFLHRQIAIGSNHNGYIRIRLFQLHQLRRQSFQVHHLIIEPDRVGAID